MIIARFLPGYWKYQTSAVRANLPCQSSVEVDALIKFDGGALLMLKKSNGNRFKGVFSLLQI